DDHARGDERRGGGTSNRSSRPRRRAVVHRRDPAAGLHRYRHSEGTAMSTPTIRTIRAGAAGTAAAKTLHTSGADVDIDLRTRSGEQPANRILDNKAVAGGLLAR